jgi:hypothetical protein
MRCGHGGGNRLIARYKRTDCGKKLYCSIGAQSNFRHDLTESRAKSRGFRRCDIPPPQKLHSRQQTARPIIATITRVASARHANLTQNRLGFDIYRPKSVMTALRSDHTKRIRVRF